MALEQYQSAEMEIIEFEVEDIIEGSGEGTLTPTPDPSSVTSLGE